MSRVLMYISTIGNEVHSKPYELSDKLADIYMKHSAFNPETRKGLWMEKKKFDELYQEKPSDEEKEAKRAAAKAKREAKKLENK